MGKLISKERKLEQQDQKLVQNRISAQKSQSNNQTTNNKRQTNQPSVSPNQTSKLYRQQSRIYRKQSKIQIERFVISMQDNFQVWKRQPGVVDFLQIKTLIKQNYLQPFEKIYEEIPEGMTTVKFSYMTCYDYNQRLTALTLASVIVGVATFRRSKIYQMPLRSLSSIKDSTVAYFVGGLALAPEIFNPLMAQ